jgi:hypothetical protein
MGGSDGDHKVVFVTSLPLPGTFGAATDAHAVANELCATEAAGTAALYCFEI